MASCEKCWSEAYLKMYEAPMKSQTEHYSELIKVNNCTLEQQAGEGAIECPKCKRKIVHQIIGICLNCGYSAKNIDIYEDYDRDEDGNLLSACCAEILDEDVMLCPACKEHC